MRLGTAISGNAIPSTTGATIKLAAADLAERSGFSYTEIPYKGSAGIYPDLMTGKVHALFDNLPGSIEFVKTGKLKALAIAGKKRVANLSDVPSTAEAGVPEFEALLFSSVFAPAGTPAAVISRVNAELNNSLNEPRIKESLRAQGADGAGGSAEDYARVIRADFAKWAKVVRDSGARVD